MNELTKNLTAVYDKVATKYSRANFEEFWGQEFKIFKRLIPGKKVIDIGCGAGRDAVVFLKNGFDYTGIDMSKGMLAIAKKRAPKGKFKIMDFYKLDFPKQSFYGFWAAASLLHIPKASIPKVLRGIRRIIKPRAIGFISVREKKGLDEEVVRHEHYEKRFFSFWKISELKKILEDNDFKVIKAYKSGKDPGRLKAAWLCFFVRKV